MIAGLPGTGIGGVFYIVSALCMPVHRALRGGGHAGRTWARVFAQSGIALGILSALFLTGWALGLLIPAEPAVGVAAGNTQNLLATSSLGVARWIAVVGTAGLLALLLAIVEIASVLLRPRRAQRASPSALEPAQHTSRWRRRAPERPARRAA